MNDLSAAGLSETEANCYKILLDQPDWKPTDLAPIINESRSNCYKLLDKLVSYKLAERFDKDKKLHYRAVNPSRLLELASEQRGKREAAERQLELQTAELMNDYIKVHDQPGVRFYQGDEIVHVYEAYEKSGEDIYFLHTTAGSDFHSSQVMDAVRSKARVGNAKRFGLTPVTPKLKLGYKEQDRLTGLQRTWLRSNDYTAPVEWGAYGNKLYIISYGREAIGMIIDSPQIAESFKQMFTLMDKGQRSRPGYETLPN